MFWRQIISLFCIACVLINLLMSSGKSSAYHYGISVNDSQITAHHALPHHDVVLGVRCSQEVTFSDKLSSVSPDSLIPASSPGTIVFSSCPTGFSFNRLRIHSGHLMSLLGCIVTFVKAAAKSAVLCSVLCLESNTCHTAPSSFW